MASSPTAANVIAALLSHSDPAKIPILAGFFKTGKGDYGEGDKFIGVKVPNQRQVAKTFIELPLKEVEKLLKSPIHEHRLTAAFILVYKYERASKKKSHNPDIQAEIYDFYLNNRGYINNWDLVDTTTPNIIGHYLLDKPSDRKVLHNLAKSKNLWDRRIAILATFTFIKARDFTDTLAISALLLHDPHDLIHKAVGWMLREIGNIDQETEEKFLKVHHHTMPRTMLRYAIEKFTPEKRNAYLKTKSIEK